MGDDVTNRVRKIKWASLIYSCEHWEAGSNHEHLWNITATLQLLLLMFLLLLILEILVYTLVGSASAEDISQRSVLLKLAFQ